MHDRVTTPQNIQGPMCANDGFTSSLNVRYPRRLDTFLKAETFQNIHVICFPN